MLSRKDIGRTLNESHWAFQGTWLPLRAKFRASVLHALSDTAGVKLTDLVGFVAGFSRSNLIASGKSTDLDEIINIIRLAKVVSTWGWHFKISKSSASDNSAQMQENETLNFKAFHQTFFEVIQNFGESCRHFGVPQKLWETITSFSCRLLFYSKIN